MTQPEEAVGGETPEATQTDPADAFLEAWDSSVPLDEEPAEGEQAEPDSADEADDDTTAEEEADDLPPIEAPVSWDADAKELFKNLPREAQEIVAKRESERERFVQSKSQEAAQAKQTAAQQAAAELAQIQAALAQEYHQFAASIQAEEPDPMLQVTDPVNYAQQMRAYRQANAQRAQAQQHAQTYAQQAQALMAQQAHAEYEAQSRIIVENFPEYADPTTGPEIQRKLSAIAKEMGYPDELIGQARATDILAIRKAADWKAKAEKYDALQAKKMEKVRAAKGLPRVATPGAAQSQDARRAQSAQAAWEATKNSRGQARDDAFAAYLKTQGVL